MIRPTSAVVVVVALLVLGTACTPNSTSGPTTPTTPVAQTTTQSPPSPSSSPSVVVPSGWPQSASTLSSDQIEAFQKAIAAYIAADRMVSAALSDPQAKTLPDEFSTHADPDGEWAESQTVVLTAYREAGLSTSGNPVVLAVPSATSPATAEQVSLYVCVDNRQVSTTDSTGKIPGKGRIRSAEVQVDLQEGQWRVTKLKSKFTDTEKCGQKEAT